MQGQQTDPMNAPNPNVVNELEEIAEENRNDNLAGGLRNYFFYLDGQQIANWFPSFSIEVFHGRMEQQTEEENNQMVKDYTHT
jgi:hypothetical protein